MVTTGMIHPVSHSWGEAGLAGMISRNDLRGRFNAFLVACQVNNLSPFTIADYKMKIGVFINFCEDRGVKDPQRIDLDLIEEFILKRKQTCGPVGVKDYYRTVKRFLNFLVGRKILATNPMEGTTPPKIPQKTIKVFSEQQIRDLIELVSGDTFMDRRNRAMLLMFIDTGLRCSELVSVQVKDVTLTNDITLVRVMGKGAKERVVRLGKMATRALYDYLEMRNDRLPCLWVTKEKTTMKTVLPLVTKLGHRAGITDVRCSPHTFRHYFAITWLRNGGGEFTLQYALGHSTPTMTKIYLRTLNRDDMVRDHMKASPVDNLRLK
jgi:integrase/recombinase XerC